MVYFPRKGYSLSIGPSQDKKINYFSNISGNCKKTNTILKQYYKNKEILTISGIVTALNVKGFTFT